MSSFIPDLQQSIIARIVSCLGDLSTTPPASSEIDVASAYDVSGNPCIIWSGLHFQIVNLDF